MPPAQRLSMPDDNNMQQQQQQLPAVVPVGPRQATMSAAPTWGQQLETLIQHPLGELENAAIPRDLPRNASIPEMMGTDIHNALGGVARMIRHPLNTAAAMALPPITNVLNLPHTRAEAAQTLGPLLLLGAGAGLGGAEAGLAGTPETGAVGTTAAEALHPNTLGGAKGSWAPTMSPSPMDIAEMEERLKNAQNPRTPTMKQLMPEEYRPGEVAPLDTAIMDKFTGFGVEPSPPPPNNVLPFSPRPVLPTPGSPKADLTAGKPVNLSKLRGKGELVALPDEDSLKAAFNKAHVNYLSSKMRNYDSPEIQAASIQAAEQELDNAMDKLQNYRAARYPQPKPPRPPFTPPPNEAGFINIDFRKGVRGKNLESGMVPTFTTQNRLPNITQEEGVGLDAPLMEYPLSSRGIQNQITPSEADIIRNLPDIGVGRTVTPYGPYAYGKTKTPKK